MFLWWGNNFERRERTAVDREREGERERETFGCDILQYVTMHIS
jgi:hypothetical protein